MNVMIVCIVPEEELQRVEPEAISAMVVNGLHGPESKQKRRLTDGHARHALREERAHRVHQKSLQWMVVLRTEGVWNVQPVMHRVEVTIQEFARVEEPVKEILPSIDDEPSPMSVTCFE